MIKAGARHSKNDMQLINDSRQKLREIDGALVELGAQDEPEEEAEADEGEPMDTEKALVWYGETVKATRTDDGLKVGGYLVRFGGADITGEHFESDTDFDIELPGKATTYFHHGMDAKVGKRKLGRAEIHQDEFGLWAETILQERDEYEKFIAELAVAGKLGWSSGTVGHLMERDGSKITRWPIAEASLTHTPAEPRNTAVPLKSLITAPEDANGASAADNQDVTVSIKSIGDAKMELTQEQLDALAASAAKTAVEEAMKAMPANVTAGGNITVVKDAGDQPFESFGEQLKAVKDFSLSRGRTMDDRLASKALGANEALPSEGGFFVQTDFSNELLRQVYETGILASRVRRVPVSGNSNGLKINAVAETSRATGSRWGGIQSYWLGEGGTKTPSQPAFRQLHLDLKKLIGLCYATDELLQDAAAMGSIMTQAFTEDFGFMVDDAIIRGTGAGQPLGILASPALVSQAAEVGQAIDTIVHENIVKMWSRMPARNRANSVWIINQDCEPQLYSMGQPVGTAGMPSYMPPGGLSGAPYATLMGRPVLALEQADTVGDLGDIMLVDLSQYLMIDKGGIQSASSIHVAFLTDETAFRFVYRVDGQPMWVAPLTPFQSATTLSPFVALAAR